MSQDRELRWAIGTRYKNGGKYPKVCTVVDIYTTYNSQGEKVSTRYVSEHDFLGQKIRNYDVADATIARNIIREEE